MADFSGQINTFERYGTYTYEFDNVGNLTFDSSSADFSRVFLAFPLVNISYNTTKIQTFYNTTFTEFLPTLIDNTSSIDQVQQQLNITQQKNTVLQSQLDNLITITQTSGSAAGNQAVQQVIFDLRVQLGQGRVTSDFSTDFPYTPLLKPSVPNSSSIS